MQAIFRFPDPSSASTDSKRKTVPKQDAIELSDQSAYPKGEGNCSGVDQNYERSGDED